MENKIMFLIVAILGLYLVFSPTGQTVIKKLIGVLPTGTTSSTPDVSNDQEYPKYSGGPEINSGVMMG